MDLTPFFRFAQRHHQLLHQPKALELGMTRRQWYWAIESGRLDQIHPGVARVAGSPETPEQRILAAVWACGPTAMSSHISAAHLWCPVGPPDMVDVIVERGVHGRRLPGVRVHRPTDLGDLRRTYRLNIAATNPLRTLLDYGAVHPEGVRGFLERVIVAGWATPKVVWAALERHRGRGRAGVAPLEAALKAWTLNEKPPDSVLEEAMTALVVRFRLPSLTFHPIIAGLEPDFLVTGTNIVIECDGWATHGLLREKFEDDRERDTLLVAAGYIVVRVTWRMITRRPAVVAQRVRAVLARHAPHLLVLGPG